MARAVARRAGLANPEECFLGGLLQDVGAAALSIALGDDYTRLIAQAGGEHRATVDLELAALAVQHPEVGAMLMARWRLPDALVMAIKYHERPTAAPQEHQSICRSLGLGNLAADIVLSRQDPSVLGRFYKCADQWFGFTGEQCDDLLNQLAQQMRDAAALLSLTAPTAEETAAILAEARARLAAENVLAPPDAGAAAPPGGKLDPSGLAGPGMIDELTGVASRRCFDQRLIAAFEQALATGLPLAVGVFAIDGLEAAARLHGPDVRDTVLIAVASRLEKSLTGARALVARLSPSRFAVLLSGLDPDSARTRVEAVRAAASRDPVVLIAAPSGAPPRLAVRLGAGAAFVPAGECEYRDAAEIVEAAERLLALSEHTRKPPAARPLAAA
jgi:GGDEF domain-containing protein